MRRLTLTLFALTLALTPARAAGADDATTKARGHYETGLELFYAREHAQALVEFQRAHAVKARPATLFMMGQCEYFLGSLRQARDHYEAYLRESPSGEFVEVAKDRVESINRRPATLVINTVPDQVDVQITLADPRPAPPADGGAAPAKPPLPAPVGNPDPRPAPITGQAPNNFAVPRGRWTIVASKPNYQSQQATVEVEVADTKPLFFKLEPIPARLEIETVPVGATLYVNGNRTSNPYRQDVPPGTFEIFGEAESYEDRTEKFVLGPGDKRAFVGSKPFKLTYVQPSGRAELVTASAVLGGLVGAGAVAFSISRYSLNQANVSSVSFTAGGAVAGTVVGALVANSVVPSYIPDNRALFVLGGMWIGAAEGALAAIVIHQTQESARPHENESLAYLGSFKQRPEISSAAFVGSVPGLALGATAGALFSRRAPTYGRVALIQSAAAGGALVGGLMAAALQWNPFGWQRAVPCPNTTPAQNMYCLDSDIDPSIPALIGLNLGLGAGLLGAYLPDQSRYGPTWKRIGLIDLAAGAGMLAGGIAGCVSAQDCVDVLTAGSPARARAATFALLGAGVGLAAGILLTRNVDRDLPPAAASNPPSLTLLPMPDGRGGFTPALGAVGSF